MKNGLTDLNNHLFEQLERLNDPALSGQKLNEEIQRAQAMNGIATKVISNAQTVIEAKRLQLEYQVKGDVKGFLLENHQ